MTRKDERKQDSEQDEVSARVALLQDLDQMTDSEVRASVQKLREMLKAGPTNKVYRAQQ